MKFKKINILLAGMILFTASCSKDWLSVNDNPNSPTDDNIIPEQIFPAAAESVGNRIPNDFGFLQNWVGYFAPNGDFAPNQQEISYNIDFNFGNALWINHYNTLFDLYLVKTKSLVVNGDTVLAGAAMILSAKLFQDLVDVFGDIPYSDAFQAKVNPRPKYDDAKSVYDALERSLDTAIGYMQKTAPSIRPFSTYDIVNKGDQQKWIRFANTLKLRLLIRQSEVSGFDPSSEIAKIDANGEGYLGFGDDISENPGYINDVGKQSPFFANYGYSPTQTKATTSLNANSFALDALLDNGDYDDRYAYYYAPVGTSYVGNSYGLQTQDLAKAADVSYFGPGLIGLDANEASANGPKQDQWIFPGYESLFLQAEAAQRGWITGDAEALYDEAVKANYQWFSLKDPNNTFDDYTAVAEGYVDDASGNPYASIASGADYFGMTPVQFIALQKYLSNVGIDPLESWNDIRRLDFLTPFVDYLGETYISANSTKVANKLPLRLLYPQSEYTTNSTNTPKQTGGDQYSKKLFWEP